MKNKLTILLLGLLMISSVSALNQTNQTLTIQEQVSNQLNLIDYVNPMNTIISMGNIISRLMYIITIQEKQIDYMKHNWHETCGSGSSYSAPVEEVEVEYNKADLNQDGILNVQDLSIWSYNMKDYGKGQLDYTSPNDLNNDGEVDVRDLAIWAYNYK